MYKSCPTYVLEGIPFYLTSVDHTLYGTEITLESTGRPDDKMFEKSVDVFGKELKPKKIMFNYPATIVFWEDGTKTVVKCETWIEPDLYNAFCAALAKKIFGSSSHLKKVIEKAYYHKEANNER